MKKTFTKLVWVLFALVPIVSHSQVYFLNENFSTATGSTPPAGWTNNTLVGDPSFDKWRFDNPGGRAINSPFSSPIAIFDSDNYSDMGGAEDVTLESPAFNTTGYSYITLKFDHHFRTGFGGKAAVEVWDGSTWQVVYSNNTTTTGNPATETINITTHAANKTGVKVRFRWTGDFSWYWLLDNVQVYFVADIQVTSVSLTSPKCGSGSERAIVQIKNNSAFAISNIPISVQATGAVSGTFNTTYTGSLAALASDTISVAIGSTLNGGALSAKGQASYALDNVPANDTLSYNLVVIGTPNNPTASDVSRCGAGDVTLNALTALSTDSIAWYTNSVGGSPVGYNKTFTTPILASTTTYYAAALRGDPSPKQLQTITTSGNAQKGVMFDIIPNKEIILDSLSLYLTTTYVATGSYVFRVYYKTGTFIGSQLNPGVWTNGGDYNVTFSSTGFVKFDIADIIMTAQTYGFYITIISGPGTSMDYTTLGGFTTYSNADVSIYAGNGVSGLFGGTFSPRGFNGRIHYREPGCYSNRVPVQAIVNPKPAGVAYQPKAGSKGFFNSGSLADPDVNAVPDRIDFQITPPAGFANSGYGTTWTISSVLVETPNGTTVPSSMYSVVNPSGSADGEFRLNTDSTYTDSTVCVTLVVKRNDNNCDTTIKRCIFIAPRPKASFTNTSACLGDVTEFTTTSTIQSGSLTYEWYLGMPGATSTFGVTTIQYPAAGNYNVTLVVTSDKGYKDSITKVVSVKQVPVANFNFVNACEGTAITFNDASTLPTGTTTLEWDFESDGVVDATGSATSKLYASPNIYKVKYKVTVEGCTDSREKYVTQAPRAVPDFSHTALQCDNNEVTFTNGSTAPAFGSVGYTWKFGDNTSSSSVNAMHTYNAFQTYTVTLIASTNLGCIDSIQKNLTLLESPVVDFAITGAACHGDVLTFTNNTTVSATFTNAYSWDFGDNNTSGAQDPAYQYSSPGEKTITLEAMSSNGCSGSKDTTITIFTKPQAGFISEEVCLGEASSFTNNSYTSENTTLTYAWDLDDNLTSTQTNPEVTYTTDGAKDVSLIATSANGCTDTATVSVLVNPVPNAAMIIASQLSHDGSFGFSTNTPGSQYVWLFGDGGRDSVANTLYKYEFDGLYEVKLVVISDKGCMDIDTQYLSVKRLGIDDNSALEGNVKMYPNPGAGAFNITFEGIETSDIKSVTVTNSLGQVVAELDVRTIANNSITVNISEHAAGIYFVNVETVNGKASFKYNMVK